VLTFEPLGLAMQGEPLPKGDAPQPKTDIEAAKRAVAPELGSAWNNAPPLLEEWVGREDLLQAISADWKNPDCRVTGLIGFGGEGKSSLARKWMNSPLEGGQGGVDGVFWWGFYTKPNVEEFFEAALEYMIGGRIDPRRLPSANVKAQILGAMLSAGRYLFVLDGLEILQHQEGDQYGLLKSNDLREFLSYFADPKQQSFCLITSRAPVLDLMEYTTYTHRDVTRLSLADGRALLDKVGVQGDDVALDKIVADWDGHALTLSLLGAYLVDQHGGDARHIDEIPPPTANEQRYARVHRVLRRYDEHLTEAERAFLILFSAFRTPVEESAFEKVFRGWEPIAVLDDAAFAAMLQRLLTYRILHYDPHTKHYTTHPLIRAHYFAQLTAGDRTQAQKTNEAIKDYYLEIAGDTPRFPTLDDLMPLIEVVHHACRAGAYDEAYLIRRDRIAQGTRHVLIHQLGAYETSLAIMLEFFPDGDTSQEPQVSSPGDKSWILNTVGRCLTSLGDLSQAVPFYERMIAGYLAEENLGYAGRGYQNLAELHAHLGALTESATAAREALRLARRAEDKENESDSLAYQAWAGHLCGDLETAGEAFQQAEVLEREVDSDKHYLYSLPGIQHADHLRRTGDADYARCLTEANLEICERNRWAYQISWCHRVLGDLDADALRQASSTDSGRTGLIESARGHYDEALKIARSISYRPALIEALLARGRWFTRFAHETQAAFSDLHEALDYALNGGYRIYETDIRIALAWAHLAALRLRESSLDSARAEAQRALQMSTEMGYYWGKIDAQEVLQELQEKISR